jgi:hypothetical protein
MAKEEKRADKGMPQDDRDDEPEGRIDVGWPTPHVRYKMPRPRRPGQEPVRQDDDR